MRDLTIAKLKRALRERGLSEHPTCDACGKQMPLKQWIGHTLVCKGRDDDPPRAA